MNPSNSDIAVSYFKSGYNCAQAVFMTYAISFGLDKETSLKLASSFGGGMGRLREVCGAVSAMFAIIGLKYGYTSNNDDGLKSKHYALIQKIAQEFKDKHSTLICRELLGEDGKDTSSTPSKRTEEYYKIRPCENFIKTACEILDKYL